MQDFVSNKRQKLALKSIKNFFSVRSGKTYREYLLEAKGEAYKPYQTAMRKGEAYNPLDEFYKKVDAVKI